MSLTFAAMAAIEKASAKEPDWYQVVYDGLEAGCEEEDEDQEQDEDTPLLVRVARRLKMSLEDFLLIVIDYTVQSGLLTLKQIIDLASETQSFQDGYFLDRFQEAINFKFASGDLQVAFKAMTTDERDDYIEEFNRCFDWEFKLEEPPAKRIC